MRFFQGFDGVVALSVTIAISILGRDVGRFAVNVLFGLLVEFGSVLVQDMVGIVVGC